MSIDILECYHKWCFPIGYTNQPSYSVIVIAVYILFNKMMATSLQFQGVCEQQQHFISHSHYMVCKKRMKIISKIEKEYSITI